jgi:hypothetical protein
METLRHKHEAYKKAGPWVKIRMQRSPEHKAGVLSTHDSFDYFEKFKIKYVNNHCFNGSG